MVCGSKWVINVGGKMWMEVGGQWKVKNQQ